ncbi:MAG: tRNA 2-thiouridine(34) synthase MnmA [Proteobacteria bacterium]|nr:tRNA 2-thiouridine(34) synthase MnmA [Pseudomonadota bacterium]
MPSDRSKTQENQRQTAEVSKVIVGMSGGVDSSVAAYLLQQQGFAVEGLFMKNWDEDDGTDYCTAIADLEDAQQVSDQLGIPLHTANFAAEYWDNVFSHFLEEYRNWRTPNPDILCNREIKFEQFVRYAETLGADYIATGHYVRRSPIAEGREQSPENLEESIKILKGLDSNKDQTYFLQAVPKGKLARCLFPLGDWQKPDVRRLAESLGLTNHRKKDSTGICFIGERRFADFLGQYIHDQPGAMTDRQGRILGQHRGLHQYTIGQRQGINLGGLAGRPESPWYVMDKIPANNTLRVTQDEADLAGTWLRAREANWLQPMDLPLRCSAKIRYRQQDQACVVSLAADGSLLVRFDHPQRAITTGQYIAFYEDDELLGGANIQTASSIF